MRRKYLTSAEVNHLLNIISKESVSTRDYCMVRMAFLHGLRVSELTSLKIDDYDPLSNIIYIRRLKGGLNTSHPLLPDESISLELWLKERTSNPGASLPWIFLSRQGKKMSRQRFYQIIKFYGELSGISISIHPHMLRHACGYSLAEKGNDTRIIQDYLGHRNIRHTVIYTATNHYRFKKIWD
ncbi:tyrosine-type recombinase/integrase [Klebsiella variicola]|uniref:tyrosine-type DNA invertase n=1 Tax=Klebsiella variicola TaxID=244366 RepID=UPI0012DCA876|nr:tyrosine-type DNA invertase [Klebsiella variicola]MUM52699.1 tyrosine-type recombinase/integrase [Klebsiella variicola]MUM58110.1 tyrosine-type recombinase/integrase [Klebsiella variicola]